MRAMRALAAVVVAGCTSAPPATGPLADPIPGGPVSSGLALIVEELVTMPRSEPTPAPGDPRLVRWARINYLGEVPDGSGRLYVPDLDGTLYLLVGRQPRVYLDVAARFAPDFWDHAGIGTGLGSVAFHPDFARNGLFYTVHTEGRGALAARTPDLPAQANPVLQGVLTEWRADDPAADVFAGTSREVMRLGFHSTIHGFQQIAFGARDDDRGLLYLAVGDGGEGPGGPAPQDLMMPQGKILRIDPLARDAGRWGIPAGNPFVGRPGALGEVYAYGLRNPHRFSFDAGRMLLGHIGEHNVESIYDVRPGDNFGWSVREGPFRIEGGDPTCSVYPLPADDASLGFTYPVAAWDHDPPPGYPRCRDVGTAVIGGFVYRGAIPELRGKYLLGDDVGGRLFYVEAAEMVRGGPRAAIHELGVTDAAGGRTSLRELAGDARVDLRLGQAATGEIYLLSKANGRIWKVAGLRDFSL